MDEQPFIELQPSSSPPASRASGGLKHISSAPAALTAIRGGLIEETPASAVAPSARQPSVAVGPVTFSAVPPRQPLLDRRTITFSGRCMHIWSILWCNLGFLGFTFFIGLMVAEFISLLDMKLSIPFRFLFALEGCILLVANLTYFCLPHHQQLYLYTSAVAKNMMSILLVDKEPGWRLVRVTVVNGLYYMLFRKYPGIYIYGVTALCYCLISLVKVMGRKDAMFILEDFAVYFWAPSIDQLVSQKQTYALAYASVTILALIARLTPYITTPEVERAILEDEQRRRAAASAAEAKERQRLADVAAAEADGSTSFKTILCGVVGGVMVELFGTRLARFFPQPFHAREFDVEAQPDLADRTSGVSTAWLSARQSFSEGVPQTVARATQLHTELIDEETRLLSLADIGSSSQ